MKPQDFRSRSSLPDPEPTDLIDKETWNHLTCFSDNAAIWTSSHYGSLLKNLVELSTEWALLIKLNNLQEKCLNLIMLRAYEEIEAGLFNLLNGYYKQSFQCLRNFLEQIVIGVYLELGGDEEKREKWIRGTKAIGFGEACDFLHHLEPTKKLEDHLTSTISDNFFEPKDEKRNPDSKGGWGRRLFAKLSKYSHPNPGYTNGDLWKSIGPIFDLDSFNEFTKCYFEVMALSILLLKTARTDLALASPLCELFELDLIKNIPIAKSAFDYLFKPCII